MGLKDILEKKTNELVQASHGEGHAQEGRRPRTVTAPGALFGLREEMGRNEAKVSELEGALQAFEGALPTRKLDPRTIGPSRWANRHTSSYEGPEFAALKADIAESGGNVQAIKVRPRVTGEGVEYEIVFGHRRHRACQELELDVLAVIAPLDDQQLFSEMDRENREREDLRPYELGMHYRRALDAKLWPTQAQLAAALGVTPAYVSQVLAIADLPAFVIECFPSPLELQVRWGVDLGKRLLAEPERVKAAAKTIRSVAQRSSASEVFAALMEQAPGSHQKEIKVGGKRVAVIKSKGERVSVEFDKGVLGAGDRTALERLVKELLSRQK